MKDKANTGRIRSGRFSTGRFELAPYAVKADESRGRLFEEPVSPTRTEFQRDRDRIIHSSAFRRLKHKTQVFVYHEGDHYRTRLTHSIEVAQIARALARGLRVDEDLAEALALVHDFGHTPFGHTGEEELDELMADWGGFNHNAQSLRIVTALERRYAKFDGLNLSWETLEGLVKHNGPLIAKPGSVEARGMEPIFSFNRKFDLELASYASIEAQCAAIADDIAYNAHDLDDGLRAGLFDLEALEALPLAGQSLSHIRQKYPGLDFHRTAYEITRRQITAMVEDVLVHSAARLEKSAPQDYGAVRQAGHSFVEFSDEMASHEKAIKAFLFEHMYRAPSVVKVREQAKQIVRDLFGAYFDRLDEMPTEWQGVLGAGANDDKGDGEVRRARTVCDFLAGMTDRYALFEHRRLFDATPDLR